MGILLSRLIHDWKPTATRPVYKSLYQYLRECIHSGEVVAGSIIPASRKLAVALSISRNTVNQAIEMLVSDGLLESRPGAGTFVSSGLDETVLKNARLIQEQDAKTPAISHRATEWLNVHRSKKVGLNAKAFAPGKPALDRFPFDIWARLLSRRWRLSGPSLAMAEDVKGYDLLRQHIARHLQASRGGQCDPDQIIITSGAQQGLDIIARVLWEEGDVIVTDDPSFPGISGVLSGAGVRQLTLPIDDEGICLEGLEQDHKIKSFLVTPSRNYPLGVSLSLARRMELLKTARAHEAWVVEDDFDCDFRFDGPPLSSLQSVDGDGRVIYVGTFSRILFPALRLGFIVAPKQLVPTFEAAKSFMDGHASIVHQAALADFFEEGYFHSHLRRMKKLYQTRRAFLVDWISRDLNDDLYVMPSDGGLHICVLFKQQRNDVTFAQKLAENGVIVRPLSPFYKREKKKFGLVMGFAGYDEEELVKALVIVKKYLNL
ncbi:MAG: PLP-dependent aminotransferase family protein [Methylocystaceae bacterium]|nr:PLP-dependent aminotransferase family protein [Methylocystaceae bacterium]